MLINCYNPRRHNLSDFVTLKSFQRQNEDVYLQNIEVVRDFLCLKINLPAKFAKKNLKFRKFCWNFYWKFQKCFNVTISKKTIQQLNWFFRDTRFMFLCTFDKMAAMLHPRSEKFGFFRANIHLQVCFEKIIAHVHVNITVGLEKVWLLVIVEWFESFRWASAFLVECNCTFDCSHVFFKTQVYRFAIFINVCFTKWLECILEVSS